MSHCDPETLALRSLGEGVGTPDELAHLAVCQECKAELASLSTVVGVARSSGILRIETPSAAVWDRIRDELHLAVADHTDSRDESDQAAPVVSLDEHRQRRARPAIWLLAAAGVGGIVLGGAVTAAVLGSSSDPTLTVASTVPLEPLPSWDTTGVAELATNDEGQQVLVVSLDAAAAASDGFQEVWLIDRNVEGMVSLGILQGTSGEFVVPAGVDVGQFPIVDVSLEPFDGDPTHSGDSIARGQIEA